MSEKKDGTIERQKGGKVAVWWSGQRWDIPQMDLSKDFHEAEKYLRGQRKDPLTALTGKLQGQPEAIKKEMLDRAYRDLLKSDVEAELKRSDVEDWLDTLEGFFWTMHLAMKRNYPEITLDAVKQMFCLVALEEALRLRDEATFGVM